MLGRQHKNKKTTRMDTIIGPHSQVVGEIKFSGGLHVEGTIKGNVIAEEDGSSLCQLSERGTIEGDMRAPFIDLNGVVVGDVYASHHAELSTKARISGNVYYHLIEVAKGAEVNGQLVHTPLPADDVPLALGHAGIRSEEDDEQR